ncbi:hypothetical protein BC940DRAFT_226249, partial [Gongronella butleri]
LLTVAVLPGPHSLTKDNAWSFLSTIVEELSSLALIGMDVPCDDGVVRHVHAHLLVASGDTPAVALLAKKMGHQSFLGCRFCKVEGQHKANGRGMYFKPSRNGPDLTSEDYLNGSADTGLNGVSELSLLPSFTSPAFYALDELHLIGLNLCRSIFGMLH